MRREPSPSHADFSVTDLMREAADRLLRMEIEPGEGHNAAKTVFGGLLLAEEVQTGLIATGHDITYASNDSMAVRVEPSITCGIFLGGVEEPLEVDGYPPIPHEIGRASIIAFGKPAICKRNWRAGQQSSASGFTLQPAFFERFGETIQDDGLAVLQRLAEDPFRHITLPRSERLLIAARKNVENPYSGHLRDIFLESNTLSLVIGVTEMLERERRFVERIGRRHYDHVMYAREILDGSLASPPKTLDLAMRVGVNATTLRANFRAVFGTTIFGYVRDQRLKMARLLILEHGLKISEAGHRVGFSNAAAFTAAYRRHFGHPPSADPGRERN